MNEITFFIVLSAVLVVALKWRAGLFACVLIALLQDPLRKLAPNQPIVYIVLVGIVFAAAWVGALVAGVRLSPTVVHGWQRDLLLPFTLFCALLVAQALHTVVRWDNDVLPLVGAIFYLAPIPAVLFAHQYAVRTGTNGIARLMGFYVVLALIWFVSIYIESAGVRSPLLGEVGAGQIIYGAGLNVKANSGLFRAAEIAAWHVATTSCFLFMLLNGRKLSVPKTLGVALVVVFLIGIGLATGRRKMLVQIVIFSSVYLFLFSWFLKGKARMAMLSIMAGIVSFAVVLTVMGPDAGDKTFEMLDRRVAKTDQFDAWTNRGLGVFKDIPDRVVGFGYSPLFGAVDRFGWFGAGLGTASQGGQYFGGGFMKFGGAGEGGLGKVAMDLGVPGLCVFLWLIWTTIRMIWKRLYVLSCASRPHATLAFGFFAFLASNVAAFAVATQAFGDVFILLTLGWAVGFLLAMPAVAAREISAATTMSPPLTVAPTHGSHIPITRPQT